jgi:type IX secretion system PorP/SprF family membrane protein
MTEGKQNMVKQLQSANNLFFCAGYQLAKKMVRVILVFFITFLFGAINGNVLAQQQPQFSHNMFNNMGINPGYAGLQDAICFTGLARHQWLGFRTPTTNTNNTNNQDPFASLYDNLNPVTYQLTIDATVPFLKGGIGLSILQDQLGYEKNFGVGLAYSYHLNLGGNRLGLGAQVSFLDRRFDFSSLNPLAGGDPALTGGADESRMFVDFAAGAFFQGEDLWFGFSGSQIRQATGEMNNANIKLNRHLYFSGGVNVLLPNNPSISLSPSVLLKTDMNTVQVDINTLATYNKKIWGGVSYRLQDALVFLVGMNIEKLSFGYSYDFTLTQIGRRGRSYGSHEVMLQYRFNLHLDKVKRIQRNIRFL